MCPKNATLSALGCLDCSPGSHVLKKGEPRLPLQVVVSSVQGGKPQASDEWRHVWSFVPLMEF